MLEKVARENEQRLQAKAQARLEEKEEDRRCDNCCTGMHFVCPVQWSYLFSSAKVMRCVPTMLSGNAYQSVPCLHALCETRSCTSVHLRGPWWNVATW